jgi:hypothetical protein
VCYLFVYSTLYILCVCVKQEWGEGTRGGVYRRLESGESGERGKRREGTLTSGLVIGGKEHSTKEEGTEN